MAESEAANGGTTRIITNGAHGSHGGDGTGHGGGDGSRAGDIALSLRSTSQTITFNSSQCSGEAEAQTFGSLTFQAHGGDGGNGGRGVTGSKGSTGSKGKNATQGSSGGNGGPGGKGGTGGRGGNGGTGGDGGNIVITCEAAESFVLMALPGLDEPEGWVSGGAASNGGEGGYGGAGGDGGPGGDSFSWTTQHTRQVQKSSTDEKGNTTTWMETENYTVTHTSPGGSQGPSGTVAHTMLCLFTPCCASNVH